MAKGHIQPLDRQGDNHRLGDSVTVCVWESLCGSEGHWGVPPRTSVWCTPLQQQLGQEKEFLARVQ